MSVTMTTEKKRSSYFTQIELEVLMQAYVEYEHIFRRKSNTAAAAKERETAWEEIAARVNACSPTGEKRTWKQLKLKYKNIIQQANRKKAEARKTGGGPPPPPLTEAEEMALSQNYGRPVAEGIPGGSSSEPVTPQDTSAYIRFEDGVICLVQPPTETIEHPEAEEEDGDDDDDEETLSAATTGRDPERPTENIAGHHEEGPSTSTAQLDTLPVKELYRVHLMKTIEKTEKEMVFLDRKIRKTDLEILLLERQLRE
ncbi:uncharacterized protein LOC115591728 isoform X2 [Sparus aurata]|uniref:uncharacterized protein LOC115591728 isoform X2 n=1 Tax=Sparus aurata TaxID=8175 RepID=UPI0011C1253D|nr:uncharacterized protein LOC115591728 isoform X2 [Sparus aurata]